MKEKEKKTLLEHYKLYLGDFETLDFAPNNELPFIPKLIISHPNKFHDYYVVATVGVSDLKLKGRAYTNCEFVVFLDKSWKVKFDNPNYNWPLELIHKISNIIYLTDTEIGYGKYFINEGNKTFSPITDMGVALIGIPVMMDTRFFEFKLGKKLVNCFVVVTATLKELKLIKHIGGINFIQHYLLPEGEEAFILKPKNYNK